MARNRIVTLPNGKRVIVDELGNVIGDAPQQPQQPQAPDLGKPPTLSQPPVPQQPPQPQQPTPSPLTPDLFRLAGEAGISLTQLTELASQQAQAQASKQAIEKARELGLEEVQRRVTTPIDLQATYNRLYQEAGLPDLRKRIEQLDKQIQAKQEELANALRQVTSNPWLSQASRAGRAALIRQQGLDELNALLNAREQLQASYHMAASDLANRLSLAAQQRELDQQTLQNLLSIAEKTAAPDALTQAITSTLRYVPDFLKGVKLAQQYEQKASEGVNVALLKFLTEQEEKRAERERAKEAAREKAVRALTLVKEALTHPGLSTAVGPNFLARLFGGLSGKDEEFDSIISTLISTLTLENLNLMKGVLSDRDIQILQESATKLAAFRDKGYAVREKEVIKELERLRDTILRNLTKLGVDESTAVQTGLVGEDDLAEIENLILQSGGKTTPAFDPSVFYR